MSNLADRAKDMMNIKGMTKERAFDPVTGSVCMFGALGFQMEGSKELSQTMALTLQVIEEQFSDRLNGGTSTIPTFNDHPETTLDDVNVVWEKTSILLDEMV